LRQQGEWGSNADNLSTAKAAGKPIESKAWESRCVLAAGGLARKSRDIRELL